jgi:hypothetical protein
LFQKFHRKEKFKLIIIKYYYYVFKIQKIKTFLKKNTIKKSKKEQKRATAYFLVKI